MSINIQQFFSNTRIANTGRNSGTKFQIKDLTKNQHEHGLMYYRKCPESYYNEDYLGAIGRIIIERTADLC